MKQAVLGTLLAFAVLSLGACAVPQASSKCVANNANEQCPPQEWLDDYATVGKLRADLSTPDLREKVDKLNGMTQRLQNSVPRGFHYDETAKKWLRDPGPPPPSPSVAPTPGAQTSGANSPAVTGNGNKVITPKQ